MARLVITKSQFAPPSGPLEQPSSASEIPTSDDDDFVPKPQPYWYRHGQVQEGTYRHLLESFSSSKGAKAGLGVAVGAVCIGLLLIVIRLLIRPHKRMSFKGKHCIVTGGSSGIGKDVAKQLAREGAHITIIARDIGRLEAALADIKACAAEPSSQQFACLSLPLGGSDFAAVQRGFDQAQAALGPCAALVNCAGIAVPQAFDVMPVEALERMLRTNLLGAMHAARAVVPGMKERQEGGRILFTSSIAGLVGLYGYTGYAATKFGLRGFAEALQMELKAHNIAVCVAFPPDTDTPGFAEENKLKDPVTARISADSSVFAAEPVAASIVQGLADGTFMITTGLDGWLISQGTAGFAPAQSALQALANVLLAGILRAASFAYLFRWYGFVAQDAKERSSTAATVDKTVGEAADKTVDKAIETTADQ